MKKRVIFTGISDDGAVQIRHSSLLHGEGLIAVFGEHSDDHIEHDLSLCQVSGGAFDEDIARFEGDFGVVAVDDRGHGEDNAIGIIYDRIDRRVTNDWKILPQLQIRRVKLH